MGYMVKPSVKLIMGEVVVSEFVYKMSQVNSNDSLKTTNSDNYQKTIRLMTLRQKQ